VGCCRLSRHLPGLCQHGGHAGHAPVDLTAATPDTLDRIRSLGLREFQFQIDLVAQATAAIAESRPLLIEAPTGSGKTLVENLTTAAVAERAAGSCRTAVVVPTRALLRRQITDAQWLYGAVGMPVHDLSPHLPGRLYAAIFGAHGVLVGTPVTFNRRIEQLQLEPSLRTLAAAFIDEIDTFVTVDDGDERTDLWPAVERLLRNEVPVVGLTGTNLSTDQVGRWSDLGFTHVKAEVPAEWLPHTIVRFLGVRDDEVSELDASIRDRLRDQYGLLASNGLGTSWRDVRGQAAAGDPISLRSRTLNTERLRLFETSDSRSVKGRAILDWVETPNPCLVLCRYRDVALSVSTMVEGRVPVRRADGSMHRQEIGTATEWFRSLPAQGHGALVITRELGGRGLDFPQAASACLISPRSNHQAVAQEFARIRARESDKKEVLVLYFDRTEEEAKAARLAERLRRERYGGTQLFEVIDAPRQRFPLEWFESRNLRNEEAL
jgi:superfamily II DNA or RNA helicase